MTYLKFLLTKRKATAAVIAFALVFVVFDIAPSLTDGFHFIRPLQEIENYNWRLFTSNFIWGSIFALLLQVNNEYQRGKK